GGGGGGGGGGEKGGGGGGGGFGQESEVSGQARVEYPPMPGQLEEEALERSRRRKLEAGAMGGRWGLEEVKQRSDEEATEQAAVDAALRASRDGFSAQFDDLDSALEASMEHIEKSNAHSLEEAARDSELVSLQVRCSVG
ncbi:unnamed protein product, partial [Choristocarpus tenellus]